MSMFGGTQQGGLFGNKPPQNNTLFATSTTPQPGTQTTLFGQNPIQQQTTLFGNTAPLAPTTGIAQPLGTTTTTPTLFGQPTTQTPTLFNQQPVVQGSNIFGPTTQPQPNLLLNNPYQQQGQTNLQNCLTDVIAFKDKFNIMIQKFTDLEKEKMAYSQPSQAQQWNQMVQPIGQALFTIDTKTVLDTSQQILASQKEVAKKLDEYISTVGLVQKITEDGLEVLKKEEAAINDYQKAQQTMKESYEQLSLQSRNTQQFSVPQKYQEQLILQQQDHLDKLTNTVDKMIKYYEKQPNMDADDALQYKLMHLQTLSNYLYMLQLKIRNISERTTAFQTKIYQQIMPDKKIEDFYTIDTHKELLDQIIAEDI